MSESPATAASAHSLRSLTGRVALVTGVSRDAGIAPAIARRLHDLGATVHATGWPAHDAEMPWGRQALSPLPFGVHRHDLTQPDVPPALIDEVVAAHGRIDIVVAVHARSSQQSFARVTSDELDRCWATNVRSIVLLAQRFAAVHAPARVDLPPTGRMLWFTSGQHLSPMDNEMAYAVSKGALHQMTGSIDSALSASRITANCINPGPVDTGYLPDDIRDVVAQRFPDRRWGRPEDVANLVEFIVTDAGAWIRGQVLNSEGGFNRFRSAG